MLVKLVILAVLLISLLGCEVNSVYGNRSGTVDNDYIEEPLSESSIKYKKALDVSNSVIDLIISADYKSIEMNYVHRDMSEVLTESTLREL